jgi:hypothetical protein
MYRQMTESLTSLKPLDNYQALRYFNFAFLIFVESETLDCTVDHRINK